MYKYFEKTGDKVSSWKSKGLRDEKFFFTVTFTDKFARKVIYDNAGIKVRLNGDLLRQNQVTYNHGPIVNIYMVYETILDTKTSNIPLENCLFGAIKLTKNSDIDKYKYSGHVIGFDSSRNFSHPSGENGKNVIIFGADSSNPVHANNKVNNILVLGKDFIQGINSTAIYVEKMYSTNFTVNNKKFCLSLHFNGDNSYLFVNGKQIHAFKAKDSEMVPYPLCPRGLSKDFEIGYMRASGLIGYVYDFSVEYDAIAVDDILDILKYLMKKMVLYKQMLNKLVITAVTFFNSFLSTNSLECISMNNQECRARPKMIDINANEPMFYAYSIKIYKCSGSCNNINNPYAKLSIPDIIKKINFKKFSLMSRINETRQILWHETCKCVCRLSVAVCNSKQILNDDKCRCECREDLVDKIVCDKGFS